MTKRELIDVLIAARKRLPHGPGDKDIPVRMFIDALITELYGQDIQGECSECGADLTKRMGHISGCSKAD